MRNLIISISCILALFSSVAFAGRCNDGWCLLCRSEYSNKYEEVVVKGATTFRDACLAVKLDPAYGEYKWKTCLDADKPELKCVDELKKRK